VRSNGADPRRWGIVGGGMLGLTLALRLAQAGERVTVLEAASRLGGLASAWSLDGAVWDRFYHVTLLSDHNLRALLGELGLAGELRWTMTRTGFLVDGDLHSLSSSLEFLRFPPLGLVSKARLALTVLRAAHLREPRALEEIGVVDWLTRWSGRRVVARIWLPLLRAKLGSNVEVASAAFIRAIIARMYAARRAGMKRELFGHVAGGYARVLARFAEVLGAAGVELRTGFAVARVGRIGAGLEVTGEHGALPFDRVVVTAPAPLAAALCPDLTASERERLAAIRYQGIVCPSLLLRRPLAGFYVTNLADAGLPFTGVIEMTALVDPAGFGGRTLVYLPRYAAQDDEAWGWSDGEVRERFVAALARVYPGFDPGTVEACRVARARYVFAIPTLHYSSAVPPRATSMPGLYLVNTAQIVDGTLNVDETVALAERAARELLEAGG
jgi:protoporphyrinogen oxidase